MKTLIIDENKRVYKDDFQGIYSINFDNNKKYVGLSINVKHRLWEHIRSAKTGDYLPVHCAMRNHSYVFEVIEELPTINRKQLIERAKYWIDFYETYKDKTKGYNLTPGGDGFGSGIHNPSAKLNEKQLAEIYDKLLNDKSLYIYEIAQQYKISPEAISEINNGRRYFNEFLSYPLRSDRYNPPILYGFERHNSLFKSQEIINKIYDDLEQNNLTFKEIAKKYNTCYTLISEINNGKAYSTSNKQYPIRKHQKQISKFTNDEQQIIYNMIINEEICFTDIAKQFNCCYSTINRINKGKIWYQENYTYPLRENKLINQAVSTISASGE